MNGRIKITSIIGAVVFFATILIFALIHPHPLVPSTWVGFAFLLYGELVFFFGFALVEWWASKSSQLMTRAGLGTIIGGYALIVIISSIFYINTPMFFVHWFIEIQILLCVVAVTLGLLMGYASKGRMERDEKILRSDAMVRDFADRLTALKEYAEDKKMMDKLIEGVRYSDTSVMVDADVEIDEAISALEKSLRSDEENEVSFGDATKNIEFLIKKRNLQTKSMKQGEI